MTDVDRITKFVIACCVLHNICIECSDQADIFEVEPSDIENNTNEGTNVLTNSTERATHLRRLGEIKRESIVNTFIQN